MVGFCSFCFDLSVRTSFIFFRVSYVGKTKGDSLLAVSVKSFACLAIDLRENVEHDRPELPRSWSTCEREQLAARLLVRVMERRLIQRKALKRFTRAERRAPDGPHWTVVHS
jgi:hypothetical protein